jgi:hypothetical protein
MKYNYQLILLGSDVKEKQGIKPYERVLMRYCNKHLNTTI